jgi:hypothetical protein
VTSSASLGEPLKTEREWGIENAELERPYFSILNSKLETASRTKTSVTAKSQRSEHNEQSQKCATDGCHIGVIAACPGMQFFQADAESIEVEDLT